MCNMLSIYICILCILYIVCLNSCRHHYVCEASDQTFRSLIACTVFILLMFRYITEITSELLTSTSTLVPRLGLCVSLYVRELKKLHV